LRFDPLGWTVKSMSWTVVSLLMNTMVVPGAMLPSEDGWKFRLVSVPIPAGMITSIVAPEEVLVVVLLVVDGVELVVAVVEVVLLLVVVVELVEVTVVPVTIIVPVIQK
jgi:hypothetical protein